MSTTLFLCIALPALIVLTPKLGTTGAALALVCAEAVVGAMVLFLTFRSIALRPAELAHALAGPVACACVVAVALAVVVPLTGGLSPLGSLAAVALVGTGAFLGAVALFARPVLAPVAAGLRRA